MWSVGTTRRLSFFSIKVESVLSRESSVDQATIHVEERVRTRPADSQAEWRTYDQKVEDSPRGSGDFSHHPLSLLRPLEDRLIPCCYSLQVEVTSGKFKGQQGTVLKALRGSNQLVVEGINVVRSPSAFIMTHPPWQLTNTAHLASPHKVLHNAAPHHMH